MNKIIILTVVVACLITGHTATAKVRLAEVFTNNMVLQQGKPLNIWGEADPYEPVTIKIAGYKTKTIADSQGRWAVRLKPLKAQSRPVRFNVKGKNNSISLSDVLVGEVWIASGQSNMEYSMNNHPRYCKPKKGDPDHLLHEYEKANNPMIRLLYVKKNLKQDTLPTIGWQKINRESLKPFSAAAYFFAKAIQDSLNVPVGIVSSSWGGTPIEDWTPCLNEERRMKNEEFGGVMNGGKGKVERGKRHASMTDDGECRKQSNSLSSFHFPLSSPNSTSKSGIRYQKMIAPMAPMTIRGFLWYQGESNLVKGETSVYTERMQRLVSGWRKAWGDDTLPFYYVQISPMVYSSRKQDLTPKTWQDLPRFWDAQTACLKLIPNTGMVVTTDIPENLRDIHPPYKWIVGERLAKQALRKTYGRTDIVADGPSLKHVVETADSVIVEFDNVGSGLTTRNGKAPNWFYARSSRGKMTKVDAAIRNNKVYISRKGLYTPLLLRFGWDEVAQPNLINKEGLPAVPFSYFEGEKRKEKRGKRYASEIESVEMKQQSKSLSSLHFPLSSNEKQIHIAKYRYNKPCAVSYTFDDGQRDHYTDVFPQLEKLGFKGTFWVLGRKVDEPDTIKPRLTRAMMKEMSDAGHEISNHSWSHPKFRQLDSLSIRREIDRTDSIIFAITGKRPLTFCYPGNGRNSRIIQWAERGKVGSRTHEQRMGGKNSKSTIEGMDAWVDSLIKRGDWGVTMIHGIRFGFDHFLDPEILWTHLRHTKAKERDVWVDTFVAVCSYVKEQAHTTTNITAKDNGYEVVPHCTLDPKLFKEPLTLVMPSTSSSDIIARQGGKWLSVTQRGGDALVDFNPFGGKIEILKD